MAFESTMTSARSSPASCRMVLSAIAHANAADASVIAIAAIRAVRSLDDDRARIYADLIDSRLNDAARAALETEMQKYAPQGLLSRKLSDVILDFGAPVLSSLGPTPAFADVRRVVGHMITVWNLHAAANPVWGIPNILALGRSAISEPDAPAALRELFEFLSVRRRLAFAADYRLVGQWSVCDDGAGRFAITCDARLPKGYAPKPPSRVEARISIDGRHLDEVRIRQSTSSFLSLPARPPLAETDGEQIVLHIPATTVVQLFAEGILPPIGGRAVDIVVHEQPPRRMTLSETRSSAGEIISLTFRATGR